LGGLGDGGRLARHANLAVAMGNIDAQQLANSPQVLVAWSKERERELGFDQRDDGFDHSTVREHIRPPRLAGEVTFRYLTIVDSRRGGRRGMRIDVSATSIAGYVSRMWPRLPVSLLPVARR